jgi:quercetin dioxygenase-like cupin family protein
VSEPVVIPPRGGEVVGDAPDRRVEILCAHDALHATWSRFGPGRAGADLHVHRRHTDLFYVLRGELTVMLGTDGDTVGVPAGTLACVPPLVVHGFRNDADGELRHLNFHAPGEGFAAYLRAIRDGRALAYDQEPPPSEGVRPASEASIGAGGAGLLTDVEEIGIAELGDDMASAPHVHRHHVEAFFVLEGELALTAGDRELRARAGSWVQVPPGVPHAVSAPGGRVLNLHAPSCGFGAFLRALEETGDEAVAAARSGFDQRPTP